jgi:hypothetical protein
MKKNRYKAETYRFSGHALVHSGSIHSVAIPDLEIEIKKLEAKLTDPNDTDARGWTARWLRRYQGELAKKQKGLALKTREKNERARSGKSMTEGSCEPR